jgi:hypothetical protein
LVSEIDQFIRGIAHRRDHNDNLLARAFGGNYSSGNAFDALSISDGRPSEFLDY